jgi:EAL domain-containing protein (putative c-di-GMP-specific phosphodiesterase class I)
MTRKSSANLIDTAAEAIGPGAASIGRSIDRMLLAVRTHLDMDVAFVSEFNGRDRVFRHVSCAAVNVVIRPGDSEPLDDGYCLQVVEGRIPQLIPDTSAVPVLASIQSTAQIPIGAHISVPILLSDGSVYGTFCCFSVTPKMSLDERDLRMMEAFAELLAHQIEGDLVVVRAHQQKLDRISAVLEMGQPGIVYQPIYRISDRQLVGIECLSRFLLEPQRGPDVWFEEAHAIGLGVRLELNAILTALDGLRGLQVLHDGFYVAINLSPETLIMGEIDGYLDDFPADRVVLELTEHSDVADYGLLMERLEPLRAQGMRVAVDDAGAGYASMRHVLATRPDIIKLDISLTRGIDSDSPRRALAAALIEFARQTGSEVTAEGVETEAELDALQELGVDHAQGYHLSRPLDRQALKALLRALPHD